MRKIVCLSLVVFFCFACKQNSVKSIVSEPELEFTTPEDFAYFFAEKYYRHMNLKEELDFADFCIPEIVPMFKLEIPYIWSGLEVTQEMREDYEFIVKKENTIISREKDEIVVDFFFTEYRNNRNSECNDEIEIKLIKESNGKYRITSYIGELGWMPYYNMEYMEALRSGGNPEAVLERRKAELDLLRERNYKDSLELEMLREQRKKSEEVAPYHSYALDRDEIRRWALDNCESMFPESAIPGVSYYDFSKIPYNYDCTNFVSHALFKGGATMNDKGGYGIVGDDQWYFRDNANRSSSWAGVPYLYNFLTRSVTDDRNPGPFGEEKSNIYAEIGDVLQFYNNRYGGWRHSAIVTTVNGSDIYYSSRTSSNLAHNRKDAKLDAEKSITRLIHLEGNSTGW